MLKAQGLTCIRGVRRLFTGLDLSLEPGQWLHVRGENGAGKTSLLRLLAGLAHPEEGRVFWNDVAIDDDPESFHRDVLVLGHHGAVKEDLTARENLLFAAALDGQSLSERDALVALGRFGLKGREELPVRVLSAGQKRRVLLARLVTRRAKLWILDEPFTALDVKAVDFLVAVILEHLAGGGMAVMTSHQPLPLAESQVVQL